MRNIYKSFAIEPLYLLLFWVASLCGSSVSAQEKLPEGFELQSSGYITAPDSLLPEYYQSYALGGQFRKGIQISPENYGAISYLLPIPVLTGIGISNELSLEMFSRAVRFHATGIDPAGTDGNGTGKGNIDLPNWIRQFIVEEQGLEQLFKYQLFCGNTIVVDPSTKVPLFIAHGKVLEQKDEMGKYYNCLYGWAAAYPWYYYELPNIALRQALSKKDVTVIELFARNRFSLSTSLFGDLISSQTIPNLNN